MVETAAVRRDAKGDGGPHPGSEPDGSAASSRRTVAPAETAVSEDPRLLAASEDPRLLAALARISPFNEHPPERLRWTALDGGRNNAVYRVESPAGCHVLRLGRPSPPRDCSYAHELGNMAAAHAAGAAPPPLFYDAADGTLVVPFLPEILDLGSFRADPALLDRVADCFGRLRRAVGFAGRFDPLPRLRTTLRDAPRPQHRLAEDLPEVAALADRLLGFVERRGGGLAPCHNDPMADNMGLLDGRVVMIDWQSAAMADPDWDVGAFCANARLRPEEEARLLAAVYGSAEAERALRAAAFSGLRRYVHLTQALMLIDRAQAGAGWHQLLARNLSHFRGMLQDGAFAEPGARRHASSAPATPPAAETGDRMDADTATIFVSIAAYRDPDCQWTVRDLFEQASNPDRIRVGICWQFVPEEDKDCFEIETRPDQCRSIEVDARESLGVCWARHKVQSLWQGEDYVLQIDSHMRFAPDWDVKLIEMLGRCPSEKPILTTYPPGFTRPRQLSHPTLARLRAKMFNELGVLYLRAEGVPVDRAPDQPQPHAFCAGGFLFGRARLMQEVPYDPYLYFQGEEITMSARLWTHGWDFFAPNEPLIWHDYTKGSRPRHWDDHDAWTKLSKRAAARLNHLLGMAPASDPEALQEIERFGLGTVRSLDEYQAYSGVDFKNRLIEGKTSEEILAERPEGERRQRHKEAFERIWRDNGWRSEETRSGPGSTLAATAQLRPQLVELFGFLGVEVLADAGCGDFNWMNQISGGLRLYLGFDVVDEMIRGVAETYHARTNHFFAARDILIDVLPRCDAILCRDVLTHLPQFLVKEALKNFRASGSRYLIATHFPDAANAEIGLGGWAPQNLTAEPYGLPEPLIRIPEKLSGSSKCLGVWRLDGLA